MLPPSMIRNVQNSGNRAPNNIAGRNDRITSTNQVRGNPTAGMELAGRTAPASTGSNNSNKNDLMQRLRLIESQLPRSMASSLPSNILQSSTTSSMQPNIPSTNNHTNILRPQVPRSNVGIVAASAAVTNPNTGSNTMNAIDIDGSSSQVVNNANNTGSSPSENEKQTELFPYILHGMLDDEERTGRTNIVSWNADGKSFRVQDPDAFVTYILGKHLKKYVGGIARRYTQFRSDLKDWGFEDSVDVNCLSETFTHHCFQKGQSKA